MDNNSARGGSGAGLDNARETIRSKAADLASSAKEQAGRQFESKAGAVSSEISGFVSALRRAGEELRKDNGSAIGATVISVVADRLERIGGSISGSDLDGVLDDIQRIARRNPAAFVGTAAALGFLATRFLKSSSTSWTRDHREELAPREYSPTSGVASRNVAYSGGQSPTGSGATAAEGWDQPQTPGSGLTATAEGIKDTPPSPNSLSMGTPPGSRSGSRGK